MSKGLTCGIAFVKQKLSNENIYMQTGTGAYLAVGITWNEKV